MTLECNNKRNVVVNLAKSCNAVFMSPPSSRESYFMDLCWSDMLPQRSIITQTPQAHVLVVDLVHVIYEKLHADSIIAFHVKWS